MQCSVMCGISINMHSKSLLLIQTERVMIIQDRFYQRQSICNDSVSQEREKAEVILVSEAESLENRLWIVLLSDQCVVLSFRASLLHIVNFLAVDCCVFSFHCYFMDLLHEVFLIQVVDGGTQELEECES